MTTVEERAAQSLGTSADPIYKMVACMLSELSPHGGTLLDVGGGTGQLWSYVQPSFDKYIVADVVRHEGLDRHHEFVRVDLDSQRVPLKDGAADVVVAVEVIEHVENPRAFFRELTRLARPGGQIIVTTPNQLSFLSKLTLLVKNHFNAFGPTSYPAHITALLEVDLRRIGLECGMEGSEIRYSNSGRIPGTPWRWPWPFRGRMFSDNVGIWGARKQS